MLIKYHVRVLLAFSALLAVMIYVGVFQIARLVDAAPQTFIVTNTSSSGAGSLYQAIISANSNGNPGDQDRIEFNIPSAGDVYVSVGNPFTITESVIIDGYTQGDATPNTAIAPEPMNGLIRVTIDSTYSDDAFIVTGDNVTLQGLSINRVRNGGVQVNGGDNFKLLGSYVEVLPDGYTSYRNGDGEYNVRLNNSANSRIGGPAAADRNLLGYCVVSCLEARGSSQNLVIQGNYIGVGVDGITELPNERGGLGIDIGEGVDGVQIGGEIAGAGNTIMSTTLGAILAQDVDDIAIQGNRILFNFNFTSNCPDCGANTSGIFLGGVTNSIIGSENSLGKNIIGGGIWRSIVIAKSLETSGASSNIQVVGNNLGVMDDGVTDYPNHGPVVEVNQQSNYIYIHGNIIKNAQNDYNDSEDGVLISGLSQNVSVLSNSISNNENMGIDIDNNGPTVNDTEDADSGTNRQLNYPTYYEITESGGDTNVKYLLNAPAGEYRIEFFSNTVADLPGPGEGEVYIGFQNVVLDGTFGQKLEHTLPGVNHNNLTMTATEINDSSPTGFGATSEFGAEGDAPVPITDLQMEKVLTNPDDVVLDGILEYTMTITNNSPDSVDLSEYSGSMPTQNNLVMDLLPPELEYVGITGVNVACSSGGVGSASLFGAGTANHSDFAVVFCGFTGGSTLLGEGESFEFTLRAKVIDASNTQFTNYAFSPTPETDPGTTRLVEAFGSGGDIIDYLTILRPVNNLAFAPSQYSDLTTSKSLANPQDVGTGVPLQYTLNLTNNGPYPVHDLGYFDLGFENFPVLTAIFTDIAPPGLTYVSSSNPDVVCPISVSASQVFVFSNHEDYSVTACAYVGTPRSLEVGETISTTLTFSVDDVLSENFTNFVIPGVPDFDPQASSMWFGYISAGDGQTDALDLFLNDPDSGVSFAAFNPEAPTDPGDGDGDNGGVSEGDGLVNTGQGFSIGLLILGASLILVAIKVHRKSRYTL